MAGQEELKLMLSLMRPKYFLPIHGEYRMLSVHAQLGMHIVVFLKENCFVMNNGEVLAFNSTWGARLAGRVPSGTVYTDNSGLGDVGTREIIRDRKILSEDGLVIVGEFN